MAMRRSLSAGDLPGRDAIPTAFLSRRQLETLPGQGHFRNPGASFLPPAACFEPADKAGASPPRRLVSPRTTLAVDAAGGSSAGACWSESTTTDRDAGERGRPSLDSLASGSGSGTSAVSASPGGRVSPRAAADSAESGPDDDGDDAASSGSGPPGAAREARRALSGERELATRLRMARVTLAFSASRRRSASTLGRGTRSLWTALEMLDTGIDHERVLGDLPEAYCALHSPFQRLLRTAEAIRAAHPGEDWLLAATCAAGAAPLLAHRELGGEPPWAVFGEAFPVGCRFDRSVPHSKFFAANPDKRRRALSTPMGVYRPGCGLKHVAFSWGGGEYVDVVLRGNKCTLPRAGLFVARFASCGALRGEAAREYAGDYSGEYSGEYSAGGPACAEPGGYGRLLSPADVDCLPWLRRHAAAVATAASGGPAVDAAAVRAYYERVFARFGLDALRW